MDISEYYIAGNNFGFSKFCDGGDVGSAMQWLVETDDTLETEKDWPYKDNQGDYTTRRNSKTPLTIGTEVGGSNTYLPLEVFTDATGKSKSQKTPVIKIF